MTKSYFPHEDLQVAPGLYRTMDMVGHKVIAQSSAQKTEWSVEHQCRIPYRETIQGQLLAWNSDGTVFVKVSESDTSYGTVVRCLGEGMEFIE